MAVLKTGGDIDSFCNKCKLVLAHVIIAMSGSKALKVECKTCRAVHAYRKEAVGAGGARRSPSTSKKAASTASYDQVLKGHDLSRAQRYRATLNFSEGDVVDHVTFGLGMVTRLLADSKIEVMFPAGVKVLVHSRGGAQA